MVIFRGTADALRTENLSQTPGADAQGPNRFERAAFMYRKVKEFDPQTNWQIIEVPGADRDQRKMAPAAQEFLRTDGRACQAVTGVAAPSTIRQARAAAR